ncbi:MAG TPA: hypothetical protein VGE77_14255 [Nocardioides sp.]
MLAGSVPVLVVPWLLVGVLGVVLPLVVTGLVAATTRSSTVLSGRIAAMA